MDSLIDAFRGHHLSPDRISNSPAANRHTHDRSHSVLQNISQIHHARPATQNKRIPNLIIRFPAKHCSIDVFHVLRTFEPRASRGFYYLHNFYTTKFNFVYSTQIDILIKHPICLLVTASSRSRYTFFSRHCISSRVTIRAQFGFFENKNPLHRYISLRR